MVDVLLSRFTPRLQNAAGVALATGDLIRYKLKDGSIVDTTVVSRRMQHENGAFGWECVFADTGQLGFADELRVIDWSGKT